MYKIYKNRYKYNNMDNTASTKLTHSWLKLIDTPLFKMRVVMCIKTFIIDVFDPEGGSPCGVY
jgi:hypothetical protein